MSLVLRREVAWIPLVYFLQAVPVTLVQEIATVAYKDLGVANEPITRWTSLIALPWSLQMLFGPLVDLNGKKRGWILGGQLAIAAGLILAAFAFGTPQAFELSLIILGLTALASALCNIATDGFYLLANPDKSVQAAYTGLQSMFYKFGRMFCVFGLVTLSGVLMKRQGLPAPTSWAITFAVGALVYALLALTDAAMLPRPDADGPAEAQEPGENRRNLSRTGAVLLTGVGVYFLVGTAARLIGDAAWRLFDGTENGWLKTWRLPSGPDLLLPGFSVLPAQWIQLGGAIGLVTLGAVVTRVLMRGSMMARAFGTYIRQPAFPAILAFVVFYRFGEMMLTKMTPLFLKDTPAAGGLALDNETFGYIKGGAGIAGIILGGMVGGVVVSKIGLRRSVWSLALSMHLPNLLYLWAAYARPGAAAIYPVEFVDQFAYGLGFAAYLVILMRIAQRGHFKTAHYAIGVGLGALCIAVAGIVAGIIQQTLGYVGFFWSVIVATVPGMLSLLFLPWRELDAT